MDTDNCIIDGCIEKPSIYDRDGGYCRTHWDEREAAKRAEEKRVTEEAGGPWPQTCPRRYEMFQQGGDEWQDTWDIREQMHQGLRARHCSYCGSLHPDDFMERVKDGWEVGPTDKNYKAYLGQPGNSGNESKFYFQHLSDDQRREFVTLINDGTMKIGYPGHFYSLPFFVQRGA